MIKKNEYCEFLSQNAVKSLLYEVSATPKPGLVDRYNNGAHKDMDFFSFMSSTAALGYFFYECALIGIGFRGYNYNELLSKIRIIGIKAENKMYKATGGANTQKGLIFSLGIICTAAANCYQEKKNTKITTEEICKKVSLMTEGITKRELGKAFKKEKMTYGEKLFVKYGIKGIRGEVESGFMTVREVSLPVLHRLLVLEKKSINDSLVQVLIHLIAKTEDTNILGRHDIKTVDYAKCMANKALLLGGIFTEEGKSFVEKMDVDFIEKNISPGGAADLLAVTVMFYFLCEC